MTAGKVKPYESSGQTGGLRRIVNLRQSQLIVYRDLVQGGYTTERVLTAGTVSPLAFTDIQIEIARLVNL
ncbi:hypothetical protein [Acaryochloris sp. IP29b_bin.137]|uniref:hypothetical protein n=1 Tax=Acaryochloris sp. IP29b_bin.137 TaxID=2969217 RepID=UPI0026062E1A|nr:hypothetical protein [Acaryochloris sp. IP29b_bin.137]